MLLFKLASVTLEKRWCDQLCFPNMATAMSPIPWGSLLCGLASFSIAWRGAILCTCNGRSLKLFGLWWKQYYEFWSCIMDIYTLFELLSWMVTLRTQPPCCEHAQTAYESNLWRGIKTVAHILCWASGCQPPFGSCLGSRFSIPQPSCSRGCHMEQMSHPPHDTLSSVHLHGPSHRRWLF